MSGEIHISESLKRRLEIAAPRAGTVKSLATKCVEELVTDGFAEMLNALREKSNGTLKVGAVLYSFMYLLIQFILFYTLLHGNQCIILSAGPLACILPVAKALGIAAEDCFGLRLVPPGGTDDLIDDTTVLSLDATDPTLKGKPATAAALRDAGRLSPGPVVVLGDGYTDMELRLQGYADASVGFGVHVKRDRTRQVCDHWVESVEECQRVLSQVLFP